MSNPIAAGAAEICSQLSSVMVTNFGLLGVLGETRLVGA